MRDLISITITKNGDTEEIAVPAKWEICPCCEGCGTDRGASVECDGGGFTSSEWAEQDDDFREDYLAGRYDRPCGECKGLGRVKVIDRDRARPDILASHDEAQEEEADYRRLCRMEQRMGA